MLIDDFVEDRIQTPSLKSESQPQLEHYSILDNISLNELKGSLQDIPEINEARVLYFKAEIKSGLYKINDEKIAEGIIASNI